MDIKGDGADLVQLLLEDHGRANALLGQLGDSDGHTGELFAEIVKDLAQHEVAEEEVLYPAVRKYVEAGEQLAEARIEEQQEAEELLAAMEKMDADSAEFRHSLEALRTAVSEHASHEEADVFPALRQSVSADMLVSLGRAYVLAKALAPTHPHPNAPNTPPGNVLVGAPMAIVDRATDAVRAVLRRVAT